MCPHIQRLLKFVWPEQPVNSISYDLPSLMVASIGHLFTIYLVGADNLAAFDSNGKSDPYCKVRLNGKKIFKTVTKEKTLKPYWGENRTLVLFDQDTLQFDIFDHDYLSKDDYMGSCYLTLTPQHLQSTKNQFYLPVLDKSKMQSPKYTGNVHVEIHSE